MENPAEEHLAKVTLKHLAESGYIMGLSTIGEVELHMRLHYDAYWKIDELQQRETELHRIVEGHESDPIDLHLSAADKKRLDDELAQALAESPAAPPESDPWP